MSSMRVYIDESGNFQPDAAASRFCCEAALAIPESFAAELLDRFVALRKEWTNEPEIKGSALSDAQTIAALRLLGEYDVMVEVGTADKAAALFEHFRPLKVGLFAQKIGWAEATRLEHLPSSHREGSLFVTTRGRLPWGDAAPRALPV